MDGMEFCGIFCGIYSYTCVQILDTTSSRASTMTMSRLLRKMWVKQLCSPFCYYLCFYFLLLLLSVCLVFISYLFSLSFQFCPCAGGITVADGIMHGQHQLEGFSLSCPSTDVSFFLFCLSCCALSRTAIYLIFPRARLLRLLRLTLVLSCIIIIIIIISHPRISTSGKKRNPNQPSHLEHLGHPGEKRRAV